MSRLTINKGLFQALYFVLFMEFYYSYNLVAASLIAVLTPSSMTG